MRPRSCVNLTSRTMGFTPKHMNSWHTEAMQRPVWFLPRIGLRKTAYLRSRMALTEKPLWPSAGSATRL